MVGDAARSAISIGLVPAPRLIRLSLRMDRSSAAMSLSSGVLDCRRASLFSLADAALMMSGSPSENAPAWSGRGGNGPWGGGPGAGPRFAGGSERGISLGVAWGVRTWELAVTNEEAGDTSGSK